MLLTFPQIYFYSKESIVRHTFHKNAILAHFSQKGYFGHVFIPVVDNIRSYFFIARGIDE